MTTISQAFRRAGKATAEGFGFSSSSDYMRGFYDPTEPSPASTYPKLLSRRVFATKTYEEMKADAKAAGHVDLKKTLNWFSLMNMGVGFMCGAGIFVSPGYIANAMTGPALFVSYLVASLSAFLSSFCYAEFTVAMPMAGAAYNYVYSTLGELIAWVTVSNLILEYILANAAAVRGFAPYLAVLCNQETDFFLKSWNGYTLDGWACGVTIFVTAMLSYGMQESILANTIITIIHVIIMMFVIIAGLTQANTANFQPFIKKGASWKSIFNGASIAFFSFIGFDALATTAEEMKDPQRDMPIGILGSVSIVTVIYTMMCVTLCLMVPTPDISQTATFAKAFEYVGMDWAKYIVAIGALLGIFTTTLIGVMGASRILVGCCRERMLPPFFATVGERRQTPWVATWTIGLCSAGIALFSDFAELANMISIGTFIVFYAVAVSLLWMRCYVRGKTSTKQMIKLIVSILAILGFAMGFTLVWTMDTYAEEIPYYSADYSGQLAGEHYDDQWKYLIAMIICFFAACCSFAYFIKQEFIPETFKTPFFPLIPCLSIFVNTFLLGQLDVKSYKRFGWWTVAAICIYLVYSCVAQEAYVRRMSTLHNALPVTATGKGDLDEELSTASKLSNVGVELKASIELKSSAETSGHPSADTDSKPDKTV